MTYRCSGCTQKEFDDTVNRIIKELKKGLELDEKDQINWGLYNAVENFSHFGEMYFDELGQIDTEVSFVPYEKGLESKDFTLKTLHTLVIHLMQCNERNCTISDLYIISDYIFNFQCRYFMMSDLKTIKGILKNNREEELWGSVYDSYDPMSYFYLLFNPRKDVVEWALKNMKQLPLEVDGCSTYYEELIRTRQAIPELRELILKTLKIKKEVWV